MTYLKFLFWTAGCCVAIWEGNSMDWPPLCASVAAVCGIFAGRNLRMYETES